jgi:hypothetical protein
MTTNPTNHPPRRLRTAPEPLPPWNGWPTDAGRTVPRPTMRPLARLDVEQARQFVMELPDRTAGADLPAAMFWLGRLAEHAQSLLDVLDATVTP